MSCKSDPQECPTRVSASYETSSKSHASSLQNERFVRDFLQKSHVKSPKRAFRTRLPPKVTRQVSKTSVSYETSSKSHASSLQNERFVRDFLQKSHVKSPKRAFRTRLPPKVTRQVSKTSVSYETSSKSHTSWLQNERFVRDFLKNSLQNERFIQDFLPKSRSPISSFAIPAPPTTPAHTPIPMSQRHSPLPQLTTSRFPAPATNLSASTRLTRTRYCACHETSPPSHIATSRFPVPATKNRTSTPQNPHKVLCLPRKVTISSHVSFNKFAPHQTTRLE